MHGLTIPENPFNVKKFHHGYRFSNKTPANYHTPGVGEYNIIDDHPSSPSMKFPKGQRHDITKEKLYLPGPGTYHLSKPIINPRKLGTLKSSYLDNSGHNDSLSPFINKKRNSKSVIDENHENQPQSALISPKRKTLKKVISLNPHKLTKNYSSPGPGAYNVIEAETSLIRQPNVVFGTSEKQPEPYVDGLCGPDYYSYNSNELIGKEGPHFSFIKSKKFPEPRENFPGPTAYDVKSIDITTKSVVKVGFGKGRRGNNITKDEEKPGPGQYQPENTNFEKGVYISRSNRPANINGDTRFPGPGSYQIDDDLTIKRKEAHKKNVLKKLLAKAKSISGNFDISSVNISQLTSEEGSLYSGHYTHHQRNNVLPALPLEQSPTKKTWLDTLLYNTSSPGPVYNVYNDSLEVSKKGTKFPVDTRQPINFAELKKNNPGPGDYEDHFRESNKGEHTFFKSRKPSILSPKTPGPGTYENAMKDSVLGGALGKAQRKIANYD